MPHPAITSALLPVPALLSTPPCDLILLSCCHSVPVLLQYPFVPRLFAVSVSFVFPCRFLHTWICSADHSHLMRHLASSQTSPRTTYAGCSLSLPVSHLTHCTLYRNVTSPSQCQRGIFLPLPTPYRRTLESWTPYLGREVRRLCLHHVYSLCYTKYTFFSVV